MRVCNLTHRVEGSAICDPTPAEPEGFDGAGLDNWPLATYCSSLLQMI